MSSAAERPVRPNHVRRAHGALRARRRWPRGMRLAAHHAAVWITIGRPGGPGEQTGPETFATPRTRLDGLAAGGARTRPGARLAEVLADLDVGPGADPLRLIEPDTGRTVRLVAVPLSWLGLRHNMLDVFGFPRRDTGTLWSLPPEGNCPRSASVTWSCRDGAGRSTPGEVRAKNAEEAFLAIQRLRERAGLPRHVFMRIPEAS